MEEQEYNEELMEEMQSLQDDDEASRQEDSFLNSQEFQEAYGTPEPEERQNQHSFLHKATFENMDTVRTTFLTEGELGRPLFSVRFLLDLHDISNYYLNPIIKQMKLEPQNTNRIAMYFWEKLQNVTSSGMSNKGFAMNLNVTKKMDATRKRVRDLPPLQSGKTK